MNAFLSFSFLYDPPVVAVIKMKKKKKEDKWRS